MNPKMSAGLLRPAMMAIALCFIVSASAEPTTAPVNAPAASRFVANLKAGKPQKIVFFGTSLTQYGAWTKQVEDALKEDFPGLVTTFNGGGAGQQSRWGLTAVKANVIDQQPDAVFIEFTVNDAVERFKMPVAESRKNVETIIDQIKAARPDCEIILQVMNPVIELPGVNYGHRVDLPAYQQMYRDVARERGLILIDHMPAWQKVLDQGQDEFVKYVKDGLHPGGPGCAQFVTPTILSVLGLPPMKATPPPASRPTTAK